MPRTLPTAALLLLAAQAAHAAAVSPLDDPLLPGRDRYEKCIALANRAPQSAYDAATQWQLAGGGGAAEHCSAVALIALHRYAEGAGRLDALAHNRGVGFSFPRPELLDQAGNAWLLAGDPAKAEASFTTALVLSPGNADILADRARARAAQHDWRGADADLSAALAAAPDRAEFWVLRSSARHAMGQKAAARADIDHALRLSPDDADALLERGSMKAESGDTKGAVADWQAVVAAAPQSDAAASARSYIEQSRRPPSGER